MYVRVPKLGGLYTVITCYRAHQLQKREGRPFATIHTNVLRSRFKSVQQFEQAFEKTIKDFDFKPGALVLVRNSSIETDLGRKSKPRYVGPMDLVPLGVRRMTTMGHGRYSPHGRHSSQSQRLIPTRRTRWNYFQALLCCFSPCPISHPLSPLHPCHTYCRARRPHEDPP